MNGHTEAGKICYNYNVLISMSEDSIQEQNQVIEALQSWELERKPVMLAGVTESLHRLEELRGRRRPVVLFPSNNNSYTVYLDESSRIQSIAHAREEVLTNGKMFRTKICRLSPLLHYLFSVFSDTIHSS